MATVRKPSSLAARKMRMAISLRLAASSLRIGFTFLILGRRDLQNSILSRSQGTRRKPFFRCIKCKGLMPRVPGVGTEPYPEHSEGMKRPMLVTRANCIGSVSGRPRSEERRVGKEWRDGVG